MQVSRRDFLNGAMVTGALAAGSAMAGCARMGKPRTGTGPKIVSVVTRLENDYFTAWNKGAAQCAEALNVDYDILAYDGQPARQIEIIQTQIAAGAKAFFGDANDTANVRAITNMCTKNGATYIAVWDSLPWMHPIDQGIGFGSYFAADDVQNAYTLAKLLFDSIGGKGNLVHIQGFPGASPVITRGAGVDKALKEYPGIKLIARQPGNFNPVDARRIMEDLIVGKGKIDAVYCDNDSMGLGAVQAIEDAKLKIPVVGHDGNPENLDMIAQGRYLASMSYIAQFQAGLAMTRAYDIINGFRPSPVERMMASAGTLVTKANVQRFKTFLGGPKLPFDWRKMSRVLHPNDWDMQNGVWPFDATKLWAPYPRPEGYQLPVAYAEAVRRGDLDRYTALYAEHYKAKIPA